MSEYTDKIAKEIIDALVVNGFDVDDEALAQRIASDVIQYRLVRGGGVKKVKYMDIAEFSRLGFLQEANRQFFHPHGLALEISADEHGDVDDGYDNAVITGVWDYRDDREGMLFAFPPDVAKVARVAQQRAFHNETRRTMFKARDLRDYSDLQPLNWQPDPDPDNGS